MQCIYLKSHLKQSGLNVAVYISQESLERKQFDSCGVYISRLVKKEAVKMLCIYLKSHLERKAV